MPGNFVLRQAAFRGLRKAAATFRYTRNNALGGLCRGVFAPGQFCRVRPLHFVTRRDTSCFAVADARDDARPCPTRTFGTNANARRKPMSFSISGSGGAPSPEQMKAMRAKFEERAFAAADKDGNGSVSKTEFAALKPKEAPADSPSSDELFSKIDGNADGNLTKAEFSVFGDKLASQLGSLQAAGGLPPQGPPPGKAADAYKAQQGLLSTLSTAKTEDTGADDEIAKLLKAALTTRTA
jgi:hypothetical protein